MQNRRALCANMRETTLSFSSADIITIGGDNIGSDNSTVNRNGAIGAHGDGWGTQVGKFGVAAVPFASDGVSTLHDFRIVVAVDERPVQGLINVDWEQQNWTIGIFERQSFIDEGSPIISHFVWSHSGQLEWVQSNQLNTKGS